MSKLIVIFDDGPSDPTWSDIEGVRVVEVPDDYDGGPVSDEAPQATITGLLEITGGIP